LDESSDITLEEITKAPSRRWLSNRQQGQKKYINIQSQAIKTLQLYPNLISSSQGASIADIFQSFCIILCDKSFHRHPFISVRRETLRRTHTLLRCQHGLDSKIREYKNRAHRGNQCLCLGSRLAAQQ